VLSLFAQVYAPQSCVQIYDSFKNLFSHFVENSDVVNCKSDKIPFMVA
jgi:hypothetical protein